MMRSVSEQTILITGATDGIGQAAAFDLAAMGASLLIHGRNAQRCMETLHEIRQATGNQKLDWFVADFSSLEQVRQLASEIQTRHEQLDVLINNAGIGPGQQGESDRQLSHEGHELRLAVNYLAPFLLTHLLLPVLLRSTPSRIVNVSSVGQAAIDFDNLMLQHNYDGIRAYRQSKLAQIMFTIELAERLKDQGVTVNCLHPGTLLNTKMVLESFGQPLGEIKTGAKAEVYLAIAEELEGVTGQYFDVKRKSFAHRQAYQPAARHQLWQISAKLTGLSA